METDAFRIEDDAARHVATLRLSRGDKGNRLLASELPLVGRAIRALAARGFDDLPFEPSEITRIWQSEDDRNPAIRGELGVSGRIGNASQAMTFSVLGLTLG